MATERVLVDTGPLVAILNRLDSHHQRCRETGLRLSAPFVTTWPVIAEAAWLLRTTAGGVSAVLRMISEGLVECYELNTAAIDWMDDFLKKYADQSPQLADASLMYVAEETMVERIFTLDRRDFSIYRLSGQKALEVLPE